MSEKIKVKVFGIKNQASGGGCNCSGSCSCNPTKAMSEMYDDFVTFLSNTNLRNHIDIEFIDILMDNMEEHKSVLDAMQQGYKLPITAINGSIKFYGGISNKMIFNSLRKLA